MNKYNVFFWITISFLFWGLPILRYYQIIEIMDFVFIGGVTILQAMLFLDQSTPKLGRF